MGNILASLNAVIWGVPALSLILGVGIYLTLRLRFAQITLFPAALKRFLRQLIPGGNRVERSSFQALCTALAATVGTGNLVGVAGAICLGGPGAVFWMWLCGILGMVTKYTEALLAVRYRIRTADGYAGGTMYMILLALPKRLHFLAWLYAGFGMIAALGVGNATQINAAMTGIRACFAAFGREFPPMGQLLLTAVFAVIIGRMLLGGAKSVAAAAEGLVPLAAAG